MLLKPTETWQTPYKRSKSKSGLPNSKLRYGHNRCVWLIECSQEKKKGLIYKNNIIITTPIISVTVPCECVLINIQIKGWLSVLELKILRRLCVLFAFGLAMAKRKCVRERGREIGLSADATPPNRFLFVVPSNQKYWFKTQLGQKEMKRAAAPFQDGYKIFLGFCSKSLLVCVCKHTKNTNVMETGEYEDKNKVFSRLAMPSMLTGRDWVFGNWTKNQKQVRVGEESKAKCILRFT